MIRLLILFLYSSLSLDAQEPQLKGGLPAFLKEHTIYPSYSQQNCIQGTVEVGFKVNAKGEVYYATVTKGMGTDLDDEALRLIKLSSGRWEVPAAHDTLALLLIPMNFSLLKFGCETKDPRLIANAITAYKARTEMEQTIVRYYIQKEAGSAREEDAAKIKQLKNELGVDDTYFDERIEAGMKKIKQGDRDGACKEFNLVRYMGSPKADSLLDRYCR